MNDFLHTALDAALQPAQAIEPKDVVLYGFGRIGRLLARLLIEKSGAGYPLRLRAIVVRGGKRAILKNVPVYSVETRFMVNSTAVLL